MKISLTSCKQLFCLFICLSVTFSAIAQNAASQHFCYTMEQYTQKELIELGQINQSQSLLTSWAVNDGYAPSGCAQDCVIDAVNTNCQNGYYELPVVFRLNSTSCGGAGMATQAEIDAQLYITNDYFECQGIPIKLVKATQYPVPAGAVQQADGSTIIENYDCPPITNPPTDVTPVGIPNVLNVYIADNTGVGTGCNGFATLPFANADDKVVMSNECFQNFSYTSGALQNGGCDGADLGLSVVIIHEYGHILGLYHTHSPHENGQALTGATKPALPSDDICATGDFISDTAADPNIPEFGNGTGSTCTTAWTGTNAISGGSDAAYNGQANAANTLKNVMSYNNLSGCRTQFSPCQKAKIVDGLRFGRSDFCDRNPANEFASGATATTINICAGDTPPTFTALRCFNWYDGLGASATMLAMENSSFTPSAAQLGNLTPGTYTFYLADVNEYNVNCRTELKVVVLSKSGDATSTSLDIKEVTSVNLNVANATIGQEVVSGWWVTKGAAVKASDYTNQADLDTALYFVTKGGAIDTNPNNVFEANASGAYTLPIDCSNLDASSKYYATPFTSRKVAAVDTVIVEKSGPSQPITYSSGTISNGNYSTGPLTLPANPVNPGVLSIKVDVTALGDCPLFQIQLVTDALAKATNISTTGIITFSGADIASDYDWSKGFSIRMVGFNSALTGIDFSCTMSYTTTVTITYPGVEGVNFPSVVWSDCSFGTPIELTCGDDMCENTADKTISSSDIADANVDTISNGGAIITSGTLEIPSSRSIALLAGTNVTLSPGFHAQAGSEFLVKIGCVNPTSLQEEEPVTLYRATKPTVVPSSFGELDLKIAPNPARDFTNLTFNIGKASQVNLTVYDMNGRAVASILQGQVMNAGSHQIQYTPQAIEGGVYYVVLQADKEIVTKKMILVR